MTEAGVTGGRKGRRKLMGAIALAVVLAGPAAAAERYEIDIPPGPLDAAVVRLAKQTGHQVFFRKALVTGRSAPALKGSYTPEQALEVLLAATDLSASRAGPHLLVLQRTSPAPVDTRQPARETDAERPFAPAPRAGAEGTATGTAGAARGDPEELEAVVVTGSNLRGAPLASPLRVLDKTELERSGHATITDALRALPENFAGGAGEGNTLTNADSVGRNTTFGSAINLRGLGNGATLVLVNGRRLAGSGSTGDYTDVSSIPTAAVERVEVLLDGASAVYGSDAVGGVVNIITRKDYEGVEVRLLGGIGTAGEPAQGQVSATVGRRWAGGGMVLSYELQRRERLVTDDRDFTESSDLRRFGGSDFRSTAAFPGNILLTDPATGGLAPAFGIPQGQNGVGLRPGDFVRGRVNLRDQRQGVDLLPKQTLNAVYVALDQAVGERLELTADGRYAARRFKGHFPTTTSTLTVGRNNPFFVSPTGAASHQISYSYAGDLPNSQSAGTVESLALTAGGRLDLAGDWRAEAYGAYGQEIAERRGSYFINTVVLNEALGNTPDNPATPFNVAQSGYFNPFVGQAGVNSPAVMAAIGSGGTGSRIRTRTYSANLQADGSVWRLPAGAVKLAVGLQARRETLTSDGFNFLSTAAPAATAAVDVSRDVTAAFAEVAVPLVGAANARPGLQRLELSLAGRVEHYETVGSTANPRVGIVWAPGDDLQFRATYSSSFRAPALRELYDVESYSPGLAPVGAARIRVLSLNGGNRDLKPQTADSVSAGLDYRPAALPGLSLGLTVFDIRFRDRIDRPVGANLTNSLIDPAVAAFVRRISPATNPDDLAYITALISSPALRPESNNFLPTEYGAVIDARFVNTSRLDVRGFDVTGRYAFARGDDHYRLGVNASYLIDYKQTLTPTSEAIERVDIANFPLRFRGRATADWTRGRLTLGGALNYAGGYRDVAGADIRAQATVDLQARLAPAPHGALEGVSLLFNVRNVFDRDPPFYNNSFGLAFDPANADPVGRYVSLQLTRAW